MRKPNLAVLGDAELVVPMYAAGGHGRPEEPGAVDRPLTRERVCQVLEGGRAAYKQRGERYGFVVRLASCCAVGMHRLGSRASGPSPGASAVASARAAGTAG
jgi:hypothetical protein